MGVDPPIKKRKRGRKKPKFITVEFSLDRAVVPKKLTERYRREAAFAVTNREDA